MVNKYLSLFYTYESEIELFCLIKVVVYTHIIMYELCMYACIRMIWDACIYACMGTCMHSCTCVCMYACIHSILLECSFGIEGHTALYYRNPLPGYNNIILRYPRISL